MSKSPPEEIRALAAHDNDAYRIVDVDASPHLRQIPVHGLGGGVQPSLVGHDQFQYPGFGGQELQTGIILRVASRVDGHQFFPTESGTA
jgi:hypothetical protein